MKNRYSDLANERALGYTMLHLSTTLLKKGKLNHPLLIVNTLFKEFSIEFCLLIRTMKKYSDNKTTFCCIVDYHQLNIRSRSH